MAQNFLDQMLEEDYDPQWGGSLEFWTHDEKTKKPAARPITYCNAVASRT